MDKNKSIIESAHAISMILFNCLIRTIVTSASDGQKLRGFLKNILQYV